VDHIGFLLLRASLNIMQNFLKPFHLVVLCSLPEDMAFLRNLTKLYVYKNFIEELPEVRHSVQTVHMYFVSFKPQI